MELFLPSKKSSNLFWYKVRYNFSEVSRNSNIMLCDNNILQIVCSGKELLLVLTTNMSNEGNKIHAKRIIHITWSIVFFREQNIGSRLQCKQSWNNACFYGLIYLKCIRFIVFCSNRINMFQVKYVNYFSYKSFSLELKVCKSSKIRNHNMNNNE